MYYYFFNIIYWVHKYHVRFIKRSALSNRLGRPAVRNPDHIDHPGTDIYP